MRRKCVCVCVKLEGNKYTLIIASGFKVGQRAACPLQLDHPTCETSHDRPHGNL